MVDFGWYGANGFRYAPLNNRLYNYAKFFDARIESRIPPIKGFINTVKQVGHFPLYSFYLDDAEEYRLWKIPPPSQHQLIPCYIKKETLKTNGFEYRDLKGLYYVKVEGIIERDNSTLTKYLDVQQISEENPVPDYFGRPEYWTLDELCKYVFPRADGSSLDIAKILLASLAGSTINSNISQTESPGIGLHAFTPILGLRNQRNIIKKTDIDRIEHFARFVDIGGIEKRKAYTPWVRYFNPATSVLERDMQWESDWNTNSHMSEFGKELKEPPLSLYSDASVLLDKKALPEKNKEIWLMVQQYLQYARYKVKVDYPSDRTYNLEKSLQNQDNIEVLSSLRFDPAIEALIRLDNLEAGTDGKAIRVNQKIETPANNIIWNCLDDYTVQINEYIGPNRNLIAEIMGIKDGQRPAGKSAEEILAYLLRKRRYIPFTEIVVFAKKYHPQLNEKQITNILYNLEEKGLMTKNNQDQYKAI